MASKTKVVQVSMNGGEVSEMMMGRFDDVKYQSGLSICKNFVCRPQGPVENRSGFAYVDTVKDSTKPVRLIPFSFNNDQTVVIQLGDKYARFHTQGKTVLGDNGLPYEVSTPWEAEDLFAIHYVQSADVMTLVHPAYPPMELKRYGAVNWKCEKVQYGLKLAAPAFAKAIRKTAAAEDKNSEKYKFKYCVSALNADKTSESLPCYTEEVTANLYAYGTTVEVSCGEVPNAKFYRFYKNQGGLYGYIGDSETPSIIDDDIDADMSVTPRRYDDPFNAPGGISEVKVTNGGVNYDVSQSPVLRCGKYLYYKYLTQTKRIEFPLELGSNSIKSVQVVDEATSSGGALGPGSGASAEPLMLGTKITGFRILTPGANYKNPVIALQVSEKSSEGREQVTHYTVPCDKDPSYIELKVTDNRGTGAILKPIINIETGAFTGVRVVDGGQNYTSPTITIANITSGSGAAFNVSFGNGNNFPAAVGYFEQRRCFAGLGQDPQRVVMTRSATEDDFTYSLPTRDDDRISQAVAAMQFNEIRHIVPLSQLLILTSGSEVRISPINSDALTPSSFSARPQGYVGASNVQPVIVNNNVIYVSARGGHVREFTYKYESGGFISGDLCLRSSHLFDFRDIVDATLAKAPYPIIWFVSTSGELLGLTYIPEQSVGSWHRHTTDGRFESCAAVAEGNEDMLYCIVRRTINGKDVRYVERMMTRSIHKVEEGFFVDCGGTYNGKPTKRITGLTWLEGNKVNILADGSVMPQRVVKDGAIDLDVEASIVHVGLPIDAEIKTLPIAMSHIAGAGMGTMKNITKAFVKVVNSRGLRVGPDADNRVEWKQRTTEPPGTPILMQTTEEAILLRPKVQSSGTLTIAQTDPLPMTVIAIAAEVELSA